MQTSNCDMLDNTCMMGGANRTLHTARDSIWTNDVSTFLLGHVTTVDNGRLEEDTVPIDDDNQHDDDEKKN